jgi:radical SAM/SPASM domain protein of ACGX system
MVSDKMGYFSVQWHITDMCDQRCKHCYIFAEETNKKINQMTFDEMKHTLKEIKDMCKKLGKLPYIYLTGGDPIIHPYFWDLLELFKKDNIPFTIMGNPFHLNLEVLKKMKELGLEKYQMSLDGMESTHDWFRKPGSFKTTLEKVHDINEAGVKSVIMTTVSKKNIQEIPDIIDIVVKNKVKIFAFSRYCPTSNEKDIGIEPLEYRRLLDTCFKKYKDYIDSKTVTKFNLKDHLWKLYLYEEGLYKLPNNINDNLIYDGCHCAQGHITILPNGDVYACRRMESKVGNIFVDELFDIWNSKELDEYRQIEKFNKCSKCKLKLFCRGCPAVAACLTGSMYNDDPQCWMEVTDK